MTTLLDQATIRELEAALDNATLAELLVMFDEESEALLGSLRSEATPDLLHALKGSASALGMLALTIVCQTAEADARVGVPPDLDAIHALRDASRKALEERFAASA